ncbi:hypothetical protein FA95DRAFT_1498730 [Auriscalpium vulgare]|uniref:Uncharacterized protein n=1 Tax=Auriscalpium vulgare TaxID=40419 RepID=A0ACB8RHH0_9AGAM|nr:hypothetical protein FA95DRAFT_1498730 [Auriscalpium vulgare]
MLLLSYLLHTVLAQGVSGSPVSDLPPLTNSTVAADPSPGCLDINNCRTTSNIVLSCLATIFACVWTAVHRNIPRPSTDARSQILNFLDMGKVVLVTLLVPEWVLAWAVRQYQNARNITQELELRCSPTRIAEWTLRHGFFISMGGFHYYKNGRPIHPLTAYDVLGHVLDGEIIPPTDDEIQAMAQADGLSKGLAVLQTLWFVIQCAARRAENIPITQIEVMTLAYTSITLAMYMAWWSKPLNVGGPIRFAGQLAEGWVGHREKGFLHYVNLVIGDQDYEVDMRSVPRVPAFYGGPTDFEHIRADAVSLFAAMIFGAIHCIAWRYAFPSHTEAIIWRVSSVAITAFPGLVCLYLVWELSPYGDISRVFYVKDNIVLMIAVTIPFAAVYVLSRLILLTLAFTTLRALPATAYQSIQWTHFIPHLT